MKPTGLSLHIGVSSVDPGHYAGWSGPLNACEADAEDLALLAKRQGFHATTLKTSRATRGSVIEATASAARELASGDFFLLSYAGHGGQLPDLHSDEPDLRDETWCLFDGELAGDELGDLWAAFQPGVRIVVLTDSCHGGTVLKVAFDALATNHPGARALAGPLGVDAPRYRFMPSDVALRTYRANRETYDAIGSRLPPSPAPIRATVRLLAACQENQLSLDGTFNGLFTTMLLRAWSDGRFKGDYATFHRGILKLMPPTQSPSHLVLGAPSPAFDAQRPFTL